LLLTNEFYRDSEDLIIEEIITFFLAGFKTIQVTTANLICYLDQNKDVKKRLLDEILPVVEAAKDNIVEKLDYESVFDLEYLPMCFYETLRMNPPFQTSSATCFTQDVTFKNGFKIKANEIFLVFM
jgi:cytochrome P450